MRKQTKVYPVEQWIKEYQDLETIKDIAKRYAVSDDTVRRNLLRHIELRPKSGKKPQKLQWFFDNISKDINTDCWIWTGKLSPTGYTVFNYNRKKWLGHRLSYTIHKGEIPEGMFVCHTCDNPKCVNPDHLFLGTPKDNMVDKVIKRRQIHKVSPELVNKYRCYYWQDGLSIKEIMSLSGLAETTVRKIIKRVTHQYV